MAATILSRRNYPLVSRLLHFTATTFERRSTPISFLGHRHYERHRRIWRDNKHPKWSRPRLNRRSREKDEYSDDDHVFPSSDNNDDHEDELSTKNRACNHRVTWPEVISNYCEWKRLERQRIAIYDSLHDSMTELMRTAGPLKAMIIEIPTGDLGLVTGECGKTIQYIQAESGADVQVTTDVNSTTSLIKLHGFQFQIDKAEELIHDAVCKALQLESLNEDRAIKVLKCLEEATPTTGSCFTHLYSF